VPIFQTALFYSIANQATNTFISNKPDSAISLMLCVAVYLFVILVAEVKLQSRLQQRGTSTTSLASFLGDFTLYVLNLVARLLTQLESTLAARFAFNIFDEAANVSWSIAVGFVTVTLLFLSREIAKD